MPARFDPDDVAELRRRIASALDEQSPADDRISKSPGVGAVQLNVRVRPEVKQRIESLARERRCSFAEIIEHAVSLIEGGRA